MEPSAINWSEVIKKEAKGNDDSSLGEVHEVGPFYVLTEKGTIKKERFYIPMSLVERFDGDKLWFRTSKAQAEAEFRREHPPTQEEYSRYTTRGTSTTYTSTTTTPPP